MLTGAITALVTPMDTNGEIDFGALTKLVNFQIENGVSGVVINGSTGESALLECEEKIQLIKRVIEIVNGKIKIIVGVSFAAVKMAKDFVINQLNNISGIDYILVSTPYYIKPTQEGLYQYFSAIAMASKKPLILYNIPGRTACDLDDATTVRLAHDFKNIIGLKDATGDMTRCKFLVKNCPDNFLLYSGDDGTSLEFMYNGGKGVISVISNLVPKHFSTMCNFVLNGNFAEALLINNKLAELYTGLALESNPIAIKWTLFARGIIATPNLRLPLTTLKTSNQKKLEPMVRQIELM